MSKKEEEKGILEKFKVTCRKCGSKSIEVEDSRGYSELSGSWGSYDFICVNCGERETVVGD